MVEMVMTAKPARRRHIKEMLRQGLETTAFVVEAVCFGEEHGPDRLIGWLVRANAADQALITTVFKGRLAHGPEGARGDYQPPERAAWRQAHRWRLELAWGLIVLLQDRPGLVFLDLLLLGVALIALVNNIASTVMGWVS